MAPQSQSTALKGRPHIRVLPTAASQFEGYEQDTPDPRGASSACRDAASLTCCTKCPRDTHTHRQQIRLGSSYGGLSARLRTLQTMAKKTVTSPLLLHLDLPPYHVHPPSPIPVVLVSRRVPRPIRWSMCCTPSFLLPFPPPSSTCRNPNLPSSPVTAFGCALAATAVVGMTAVCSTKLNRRNRACSWAFWERRWALVCSACSILAQSSSSCWRLRALKACWLFGGTD